MIKLHQRVSVVIGILLTCIVYPTAVLASGSSLDVVRSGDTMYLSTTTDPQATSSGTAVFGDVELFKGYARTLGGLITSVLTLVILIAALLVLLQLITAAFQWLTSGGDKGKTDEARSKIVAAVVGLIIVAAAWAVFLVVLKFLGF
ncbi:MAG: hypothetical protein A3J60_00585, partial [Candidatus Pacebacteria bacterium RIFCSPHIGHO2_02_FULL_46_9]